VELSGKAPLAEQSLLGWLGWASRSRLTPFIKLSRTLRDHLAGIRTHLKQRFTNGLAEGMNNKIRMVSHRAFLVFTLPMLSYR
jgi:transposase